MKKDEKCCQSRDRRGGCLGRVYVSRACCRGHLTVLPVGWWLHFLFQSVSDPPSDRVVFGPSSKCAVGKVFVSYPRILPFTSEKWICISQTTDLDIITSEREITSVEQLAICCTSARFMAVCGPEIQSIPSPLSRQRTCLFILLCVFQDFLI